MGEKAVTYRRVEKITGLLGTAVNVVQMVFGNTGEESGTGVCFTRDPSTGEKTFFGDFLLNAQGEDVVAGIRTPLHLSEMSKMMPKVYKQLEKVRDKLEKHYRDMQDMEFTVEDGTLYMLQTRTGKRSPAATFRIAVDMANEKLISATKQSPASSRKTSSACSIRLSTRRFQGRNSRAARSPRASTPFPAPHVARPCSRRKKPSTWAQKGEKVILVRRETSPEDVGGMYVAQGILTATGGKTSHAAVVARGWGKCCIVGAERLTLT